MLCPRHEVEAWYRAHYTCGPTLPTDAANLISRLEARDQALREAAAQALCYFCRENPVTYEQKVTWSEHSKTWRHERQDGAPGMSSLCDGSDLRKAPLGECPQCRAEVAR